MNVPKTRNMRAPQTFSKHLALSLICAASIAFLGASPNQANEANQPNQPNKTDQTLMQITAAHTLLVAHFAQFEKLMGASDAADLDVRLNDDLRALTMPSERPEGYPLADWNERLRNISTLDSSIVRQVLAGKSDPWTGIHGLADRLFVSKHDDTLQQFAIYVPPAIGPDPSLVILLHGNPQTEAELLSGPYFMNLADSTGTILVAPYGRGNYDFAQPAADEVYQLLDEITPAYHIAPHRTYLAGYSMGGFSVFKLGPMHGDRWKAVMCISGAILNSEAGQVADALRRTPFYIVNGARDDSIPPVYGLMTAQFLDGIGIPTEFDQEPTGTHYLASMLPALTRAWHNMLAGALKNPPPRGYGTQLLSAPPTMSTGVRP